MLYQVIPTTKSLMLHWKAKLCNVKYVIFHNVLHARLKKLNKYYKKLDNLEVYILALCKSHATLVSGISCSLMGP